ncbi:MAG TPA: FUSC family protein [Xanthobacteraceae bacterium]|nr:FUSC family protein [Xanthobacteraceae bacterium]
MTKAAWFRPVVFSVNCYLATILTMFIAFSLDLKSPGWAMTTVYLTSQPISGAMRAKAVYRVIGTLVGGAVMVAIVPNLVDAPELTTAAIILWVTVCLFVAMHDRTPRSYMFVLSGYTAALIGFPSVLAPGTVFDTAVSRVEEITVGVVCAALVHSLFFPKSALSAFQAKLQSTLADARTWIADGLTKAPTPESEMKRRSIAGDITELYVIATSLRFDTSPVHPDIGIIRAFDRKVVGLLPLLSAIEDRLTVLRGLGPLPDSLARVVAAVHDWVLDKSANDPERAQSLRQAALAATPAITGQSPWRDLVAANLTARLAELIESWQAKLDLAVYLADPSRKPSAEIRALGAQLGEKPLHTDWGIALLSALAATVAMGICAFFWIVTAWPEGASAIAIAAVSCTLFASLDDPTTVLKPFAAIIGLCIPVVLVYQFFILPAITGFELLSLSLAFVLIPAGLLMAIPRYAAIGLAVALAFTVEMSLQTRYTADFAQIVNSNSAFFVGALAGLITTQLMRTIGVQTAARRLMHATYRDLASLADGSAAMTRDEWASRMLDRVGLLLFRRPRFEARPTHEFADALGDLRVGANIIEARSVAPNMSVPAQESLAAMFTALAPHFRALARGHVAPLGDDLLQKIDVATGEVAACTSATHACVAAIVGLRRTLYPDAEPYQAAKSLMPAL